MAKKIIWAVVFTIIAALLQSTVMSRLVVYIHALPDLALCILVYAAYVNGTMAGQLTGFFSGFFLDFLSAAPLGLNAFIRTITGALTGVLKDTFYLDHFFLPMALCAGATAFKALLLFLLHLLFAESVPAYTLGSLTFWIELGMNTLSAPLLFGFLRLFGSLLARPKEGAK
jgi:rod shape-determining protein MreD